MSDTSRYRVLNSLGKGGMGEVFLADDTQLGRKVAIKFLADGATNDSRALERLYREARSAAALDHPYICKIHEITEVEGETGIVMEHVSGATLQVELARSPVSPTRAIEIAGEVAEALEAAHKKRVIHRDLKPANVMLTEDGHVKVMDFGLAKQVNGDSGSDERTTGSLTDPGVRVGTPGYMSPEQLLGSQADERSDIFAFGVLLYELLAGVHPFRRSSSSGTMAAILREPHAPVSQHAKDTSETTRITLDRLLAKEPSQRYQSFHDVRTALRQLESGGLTEGSDVPKGLSQPEAKKTAHRTPLIGRETESSELRALLSSAGDGGGAFVTLAGEPRRSWGPGDHPSRCERHDGIEQSALYCGCDERLSHAPLAASRRINSMNRYLLVLSLTLTLGSAVPLAQQPEQTSSPSPAERAALRGADPPAVVLPDTPQVLADSRGQAFRMVPITGLRHPWALAFLPNGDILVTEHGGQLRIIHNGVLDPQPIAGVPEANTRVWRAGLMDVAVHPRYTDNKFIYLTYSKAVPEHPDEAAGSRRAETITLTLARARFEGGPALTDVEDIFVSDARCQGACASRIAFARDGTIIMTTGMPRGNDPQNPAAHEGKGLAAERRWDGPAGQSLHRPGGVPT